MIQRLTDYYRFERLAGTKSKNRMDCVVSNGTHQRFEESRFKRPIKGDGKRGKTIVGGLGIYYVDTPDGYSGNLKRKPTKSITMSSGNLSGVYDYDMENGVAFGDVSDTADAILFLFHNFREVNKIVQDGSIIEVFIARGCAHQSEGICQLYDCGELDDEIQALREEAITEKAMEQMAPNRQFVLYPEE